MSPRPDTTTGTPAQLGKYELRERIGIGGMGEVFLARERGVAGVTRMVVVKRLLPELAEDPEQVALFIDEARITARLAHPNIAQVYEFGVDDGVHFLAMEYVPGQNLARLFERGVRDGDPLPRQLAIYVAAEVARGLHFAHSATDEEGRALDIVHRDISPHNVMISRHGDVKLMDFGIASAAIRRQRTRTGVLRGKFAYMSPEQAAQSDVDARSDVFSAGVVLWETTVGHRLFAAPTELETIRRVSEAKVPRPHKLEPTYPEALETIVMTALAREPDERFQTADALERALRSQLVDAVDARSALSAWVARRLPEGDAEERDERVTADVQMPRVTVTAEPAPDLEPGLRTVPERGRFKLMLGLVTLVAIGMAGFAIVRGVPSPATSPESAAELDAGAAVAEDAAPHDALVAVAAVDAGVVAAKKPSRPRSKRPRRPTKRAPSSSPDAGFRRRASPLDAAPRPKPKPSPGRLAVASDPWGTVSINGKTRGPTNLQVPLAAGHYRVSVRLSDGSGTVSATAVIASGKKTKCRATQSSLVCQSPR